MSEKFPLSVTNRILRNPHILPSIPSSIQSQILISRHHERVINDQNNGMFLLLSSLLV